MTTWEPSVQTVAWDVVYGGDWLTIMAAVIGVLIVGLGIFLLIRMLRTAVDAA